MKSFKPFTLSSIILLLVCSCASSPDSSELRKSVHSVRRYVDSFDGLAMEQVKIKLAGAKLTEEAWDDAGFGGKQLVATYPEYEIRVLFYNDLVITTSFQVLSSE